MSERAKMAYQDGQKPLNKWNKDDIIKEVEVEYRITKEL